MTDTPERDRALRILYALAAFVVVVAGLRAAASIVVPFLLALFVAIICAPPLLTLREWRLPRWLALTVVVLGVIVLFALVGVVLGTSVNDFTRQLPSYERQLRALLDAGTARLEGLGRPELAREVRGLVDTGAVLNLVASLVAALGSALTNTLFILLTTIFLLAEAAGFRGKLAAITRDVDGSMRRVEQILENVRRYLAIKTLTSLTTGALVAAGLAALRVDFPYLWGLLAFLLNFVPNIGSFLAAVPGVLQALVQLGWGPALAAAAIYTVVNLLIGTAIEPRLMGRSVGLSTFVVFASLVFWGWVLGPVGMLLSVPLTMAVKIALESDPATHWVAVLLGPPLESRPEAAGTLAGEAPAAGGSPRSAG